MTRQQQLNRPSLSDALPIGVLMRLMSSQTSTVPPELPLYRVQGLAEAYQLAAVGYDARRKRQLVLMSPPKGRWLLNPVDVATAVGADADVVMIDDAQTVFFVAEAITKSFAAFSGNVRVLRPNMTETDQRRHRSVWVVDTADGGVNALASIQRIVAEGVREQRCVPGAPDNDDAVREAVDKAVAAERKKTKEVTTRLTLANRLVEKLKRELTEERTLFADPHAQYRYDLHSYWLRATEEGDRPQWPLREWELGLLFLDSIAEQQIVSWSRVMRACVDVITGRHKEINSRASHRLRSNNEAGSSSDPVIREDGAVAWRCSINLGPAAARLMWWERPDGVVELSLVASHDDVRIA
jgi:hypothetical protein